MKNFRQNLSRRFDGEVNGVSVNFQDADISKGVANYMQIIVTNDADTPLPFALIPANFDLARVVITPGVSPAPDTAAI